MTDDEIKMLGSIQNQAITIREQLEALEVLITVLHQCITPKDSLAMVSDAIAKNRLLYINKIVRNAVRAATGERL